MQHKKEHLKNSDFLTDVVIGMSDGLIVPFALVAGLSRVVQLNSTIFIAGVSTITAGAILMGLGRYFTEKKESNLHTSLHSEEGKEKPAANDEEQQVKAFLANIGLSEEMQEKAMEEINKDEKQWADLMTQHELEIESPEPGKAAKSALNTGLSYAIGGGIPVSPYFFVDTPFEGLKISAILTLLSLFVLGFVKGRITSLNPWLVAVRVTAIGALAAVAAFGIAKLFD